MSALANLSAAERGDSAAFIRPLFFSALTFLSAEGYEPYGSSEHVRFFFLPFILCGESGGGRAGKVECSSGLPTGNLFEIWRGCAEA